MHDRVKVVNDHGRTTSFTRMIWDNMGKNKNGWRPVEEKDLKSEADKKALAADKARSNRALKAARKFEEEGETVKALAKYEQALDAHPSPSAALNKKVLELQTEVEKIRARQEQLAAERRPAAKPLSEDEQQVAKDLQFTNLVTAGDKHAGEEDYSTAIAFYEAALEVKSDDAVKEKLENAKILAE